MTLATGRPLRAPHCQLALWTLSVNQRLAFNLAAVKKPPLCQHPFHNK